MTHPAHLIEMARNACQPVHMPSGVAVPLDIRKPLTDAFGQYRLLYDHGFGYLLQIAGGQQLLIGGKWNHWAHVRRWIAENTPSKAGIVPQNDKIDYHE